MSTLLVIFFVLLFIVFIVALLRDNMYWWDNDVVETTTTTTTTTTVDSGSAGGTNAYTGLNVNGFPVVGMIAKQFDGTQPFVIDPVDGAKWFLNETDDLYEDAEGKWWAVK